LDLVRGTLLESALELGANLTWGDLVGGLRDPVELEAGFLILVAAELKPIAAAASSISFLRASTPSESKEETSDLSDFTENTLTLSTYEDPSLLFSVEESSITSSEAENSFLGLAD
jgi:hypothetical protein